MELKMIIAGFGGQGVMVTGKLLGYAACAHNKQAMFLPQYGPCLLYTSDAADE